MYFSPAVDPLGEALDRLRLIRRGRVGGIQLELGHLIHSSPGADGRLLAYILRMSDERMGLAGTLALLAATVACSSESR